MHIQNYHKMAWQAQFFPVFMYFLLKQEGLVYTTDMNFNLLLAKASEKVKRHFHSKHFIGQIFVYALESKMSHWYFWSVFLEKNCCFSFHSLCCESISKHWDTDDPCSCDTITWSWNVINIYGLLLCIIFATVKKYSTIMKNASKLTDIDIRPQQFTFYWWIINELFIINE